MPPRVKELVAEYGKLAVIVWFSIYGLVVLSIVLAITMGFEIEGVEEGTGTFIAAWGVTRLSLIPRIAATAFLTPIVAKLLRRRREAQSETAETVEPSAADPGDPLEEPSQ